ncbi:WSC domain-containing protein [Blastomyces gilchristii SLH14081]|uniref:WSC domain-containing protein n=1 Tax=Blastomyces gilchristii (strain SLH14081) TaxID=559298 RepID=A0A179U6Q9_BLAGS|nr:WSC domain-containing protein [Blastomyces gilchristii SLH14081]OAT03696.1 WSC domain-containing protein [Blastomyces gilchristii SLH14081]
MKFIYQGLLLAVLIGMGTTDPVRVVRQVTKEPQIQVNKTVDKGCYKSSKPLEDFGEYTWQSTGHCQQICVRSQKPVMALFSGSNCYCGDQIPRESDKTKMSACNSPCDGWPSDTCGGEEAFHVLLTGFMQERFIPVLGGKSTTADSSSSTQTSSTSKNGGPTVVVTADSDSGNGPNKAGIAAGVVVGVVALGALIGGGFFFMKYKKRKAVEEEYRRNATISSFVSGGKPGSSQHTSLSDSRLDPVMMSQRRQSNGSIADDQDFSRRILKVTNPDGGHY